MRMPSRSAGPIVAAISVIAIVGFVSPSPVGAAIRSDATTAWAPDIPRLATPTCPADMSPLMPTGAQRTPHGGIRYTFQVAGQQGSEVVPPAGFNPLNATDAELAEMNFPGRPAAGDALNSWRHDMSSYRGFRSPAFCQGKPITRPLAPSANGPTADHSPSWSWAGYVNRYKHYGKVVSHWTQNSAHTCGCSGPTDEVTWVGLGGANFPHLIQAGTRLNSNHTPNAWWEFVGPDGAGVTIQDEGTVGVGDDIAAAVSWNAAGTVATFAVVDGGRYIFNFPITLASIYYDDSTAEFINERPCYAGNCDAPADFHTLSNYIQTNFTAARVYLLGSTTPNAFTSMPYYAVVTGNDGNYYDPPCGNSSHLLQYPQNASGQSFDIVWCRAS
jgi:hypothetical protein